MAPSVPRLFLLVTACLCAATAGRARTPGSLDPTFNPGSGPNALVSHMVLQPDGKLLISGAFTTFDDVPCRGMARLDADGSPDPTFVLDPGGPPTYGVAMAVQPDGKIVVAGVFQETDYLSDCRIERLNADGSLDPTFIGSHRINGPLSSVVLQPDGKVIVGGYYNSIDYVPLENAARFNADGSLDKSFVARLHGSVDALALQPDGKVIVGGYFTFSTGVPTNGIQRLNADGSLDPIFKLKTPVVYSVASVVLREDGEVVFAADDTGYWEAQPGFVFRFNADGSQDAAFDTGYGLLGGVSALAMQPDGKVIIGGSFYRINGAAAHRLARLNADGSQDTTFDPGTGADDYVQTMALQADGKLVIGGEFKTINGAAHPYLARLDGNPPVDLAYPVVSGSLKTVRISRGAGQKAKLTLTRTGDLSQTLDVAFVTGGDERAGYDYKPLAQRLEILAGQRQAKFKVKPLTGGSEGKLTITLRPGANYTLAGNRKFKVKIED